jgi:gamma-glutamylcyclotransferase (GGCT)/AIG2-like uncharacterized protein YtfP
MQDRLFVFGTLLSGYDHPMARLVTQSCELIGPAHCQGRLYLVRHYPGMVLSDDPAEKVYGELYRMKWPDELLPSLDEYEGFGDGFPPPNEFVRELCRVTTQSGESCEAWTYLYNRPVDRLPRIASGRFMEHVT